MALPSTHQTRLKRQHWLLLLLFGFAPLLFSIQVDPGSPYLFLVFEGSDWCSNCRQLEKEVLSQEGFTTFLEERNIQLQKVDFPQRKRLSKEEKKANEQLAERYGFQGNFPTMFLSRSDTLQFVQLSYDRQSSDELQAEINQLIPELQP